LVHHAPPSLPLPLPLPLPLLLLLHHPLKLLYWPLCCHRLLLPVLLVLLQQLQLPFLSAFWTSSPGA
jgi:hypothetical protein